MIYEGKINTMLVSFQKYCCKVSVFQCRFRFKINTSHLNATGLARGGFGLHCDWTTVCVCSEISWSPAAPEHPDYPLVIRISQVTSDFFFSHTHTRLHLVTSVSRTHCAYHTYALKLLYVTPLRLNEVCMFQTYKTMFRLYNCADNRKGASLPRMHSNLVNTGAGSKSN